jgi:hypothetical protein
MASPPSKLHWEWLGLPGIAWAAITILSYLGGAGLTLYLAMNP